VKASNAMAAPIWTGIEAVDAELARRAPFSSPEEGRAADVTADDAGSSKPSPDIFMKALKWLAPIAPSQTCVIGDTKYDGQAATRARIPFVGVLSGGSSKKELESSGAIAIYRDPADLLAHWSRWRQLPTDRELSGVHG
jgi:hypothetical protein